MKTEHMAGAARILMLLIFAPAFFLAATGCGGGYGSGGGGGGGGQSPTITSLSPTSGPAGTPVTITGNYFGAGQGSSTVTFNGTAASPTSWSNTTIDVPLPPGATSGNVVVTVGGVASNGVIFTVSGSGGGSSAGWKWIQDSPQIFCTSVAPGSQCNISLGEMTATVQGSVWILQVQTGNCGTSGCTPTNVTMTSVTGGGGTWVHCANCHVQNPSGFNADAWYNLTGNAGTNQGIAFTLSGSSGSVFSVNFVELLPPPGTTASFDTAGTAAPSNCTTCAGPTLTLTGTDAVWMNPGGATPAGWNASGPSPYFTDSNGGTVGLNITAGTTTSTIKFQSSSNPEFIAMAFKASSGNFTPPTTQYSIVNITTPPNASCSMCTFAIPVTGAGHLLYLQAGNEVNVNIVSVSGAGTWTVPTACQAGAVAQGQNNHTACAYNLSSTAGATSLTVAMSGSGSQAFVVYEVATTGGAFALDAIGATVNSTATGYYYSGQQLTTTGNNDVIFQMSWDVGGSLGPNYYPMPQIPAQGTTIGPFNYFLQNEAAVVVLLDSGPSPPTPMWINAVPNQTTFVTGAAFH